MASPSASPLSATSRSHTPLSASIAEALERDADPGEPVAPCARRAHATRRSGPSTDADDLVDAVAEDEAAIVHGDRRALLRNELPIQVHGRHDHSSQVSSAFDRLHERRERQRPAGHAPRPAPRRARAARGANSSRTIHGPGARIAPPVVVEPLDERLGEQRLQLPRAKIARRVEARIHVHERVGALVPEPGRAGSGSPRTGRAAPTTATPPPYSSTS